MSTIFPSRAYARGRAHTKNPWFAVDMLTYCASLSHSNAKNHMSTGMSSICQVGVAYVNSKRTLNQLHGVRRKR